MSANLSSLPGAPRAQAVAPAAVTLQFADNTLLSLLLGDHDRHLVRLEQGLGVRLACRGNRVAVTGEPARVEAAQGAINGLYQRLQRGEAVGMSEVDAAIRLAEIEDPRLPCLLYTSPSPRDGLLSRMPSSA